MWNNVLRDLSGFEGFDDNDSVDEVDRERGSEEQDRQGSNP